MMSGPTGKVDEVPAVDPFIKWFVISAGLILGLTGMAKVWSAFGDVKLLTVVDPIVGIQFKYLMLAVGGAELVIAAVCLFTKANRLATVLVAQMATNFLVYRLDLWWMGWKKPCSCLGNLTDALGISPHTADIIIKVLLAYLLIGSYGLLIWEWILLRRRLRRTGGRSGEKKLGNGRSEMAG